MDKKELAAMDALRRSCCVSRLGKISNEEIIRRTNVMLTILGEVERKQLIWYVLVKRTSDEQNRMDIPRKKKTWKT